MTTETDRSSDRATGSAAGLAAVHERRFAFGRNWTRFLAGLDDTQIDAAEASLREAISARDLIRKRFLDAGSGSGLFSLAARRLGADVVSFDFDQQSVECTSALKQRYRPDDSAWSVGRGSVLDDDYIRSLGLFDVVYCWGVLHHTGRMYRAMANVASKVGPKGVLVVAIYNDQAWISRYWTAVKRIYNASPLGRIIAIAVHAPYLVAARWIVRTASGRPLPRGMSLWHDMIDWVGGYPFEVAKPEQIFQAMRDRGFVLERLKTCGGRMGCNEFVFRRE